MRDLSLHLLDLVQNSISAGASLVEIRVDIDEGGRLEMKLKDNGKGMDAELLRQVTSPFATTRTTRKVGLGIPLMMENAEKADGGLNIVSEPGVGTELTVHMNTRHIDCLPLGDLTGTLLSLMLTNPLFPEFVFEGSTPAGSCSFDTREVRGALGSDIPLNEPEVAAWLQDALKEEIDPIYGGMNV